MLCKIIKSHVMNKFILWLLFVLLFNSTNSQNAQGEKTVKVLKKKMEQSHGGERLKWMDSLSNYFAMDTDFKSDSLIKITQQYAIQLDSVDLAIKQTIHLMYYQNIIKGNSNKAKKIFEAHQYLFPRIKSIPLKCKFLLEGAITYFYLRNFNKAMEQYHAAEQLANKHKLDNYTAKASQGKGMVHTETGNFGAASLSLQNALKFFVKVKDTSMILDTRNSLSILYSKNNFFKEAKSERDALIELSLKAKEYDLIPIYCYNYASDYKKLKNQKARIASLKKSLKVNAKSKFKNYLDPYLLAGITTAYAENDSLQKAKQYFEKLKSIYDGSTEGGHQSVFLEAQKSIAFLEGDFLKALLYGKKYVELSKNNKQYEEFELGEKFLSDVYLAMNDNTNAFKHFKSYTHLKDSIGNATNLRVLSYYQTLYETEKRDFIIKSQETNIALLNEKNKLKNQYILFGSLSIFAIFVFVILYRSSVESKKRQQQQQQFTTQLMNTQEAERSRVARELHDSVGQKLLVLKTALTLNNQINEDLTNILSNTVQEIREMSHNLHPVQFEKLGLKGSLDDLAESFQQSSKTFYSTNMEPEAITVPKEKEIVIFRIIQECLVNVEKHAKATACIVEVKEQKNKILFVIKDNGIGFNQYMQTDSSVGLGMISIKERALQIEGFLKIDSEINVGTTISLLLNKK